MIDEGVSTTQDFYARLVGFALLVVVLITIISPIRYTLTDSALATPLLLRGSASSAERSAHILHFGRHTRAAS